MSNIVLTLHNQLALVAPIDGVSIGRRADKTTWRIDFKPEATIEQRIAAQTVLDSFDPTTADTRSDLAKTLDTAIVAMPSIDPRIKAVFVEWRKQVS